MACVGHIQHGMWTHPRDRSSDYTSLDHWVRLARMLERGLFDGLFLADVLAKSPTVIDGIRPRKSGSHQTHRWRRQSRANPSLKTNFPASWENE